VPEGAGRLPFESIGYQVNLTARATRALLDARLAERGVTFADWVVLVSLATRGDQIQRDLARLVDVEGPTMVRRLDQLEGAGLVARSPVPSDRRATRISLTAAGRRLYEQVQAAVKETDAELRAGLDPQDLATTERVLRRLTERARSLRVRRPGEP
jgi:MarR family transcriptional regulator, transcriptional regulator for hemolysin